MFQIKECLRNGTLPAGVFSIIVCVSKFFR